MTDTPDSPELLPCPCCGKQAKTALAAYEGERKDG
jgi:hypothetical protein